MTTWTPTDATPAGPAAPGLPTPSSVPYSAFGPAASAPVVPPPPVAAGAHAVPGVPRPWMPADTERKVPASAHPRDLGVIATVRACGFRMLGALLFGTVAAGAAMASAATMGDLMGDGGTLVAPVLVGALVFLGWHLLHVGLLAAVALAYQQSREGSVSFFPTMGRALRHTHLILAGPLAAVVLGVACALMGVNVTADTPVAWSLGPVLLLVLGVPLTAMTWCAGFGVAFARVTTADRPSPVARAARRA